MIKIKGKNYIMVHERLLMFRKKHPDWTIETEIIELTEKVVTLKAVIRDDKGAFRASGLAQEVAGSSNVNQTSYVENAETSAWGRALANLGIGIDTSIASAEEIETAIDPLDSMPADLKQYFKTQKMKKGEVRKECKLFSYDWELLRESIRLIREKENEPFESEEKNPLEGEIVPPDKIEKFEDLTQEDSNVQP